MRQRELVRLIAKLGELTRLQRQLVIAQLKAADGQAASVEVIEERGAALGACPHCKGARVVRNGRADGLQRFKCRGCGRTFNALTGTPLARLRMKGAAHSSRGDPRRLTIRQGGQGLGVNAKTAFLATASLLRPRPFRRGPWRASPRPTRPTSCVRARGSAKAWAARCGIVAAAKPQSAALPRAGAGAGGPRPRRQNRRLHPPGR